MIRSSSATAKRRRNELAYAAEIRQLVMQRDPVCRAYGFGACSGPLTWAHLVPRSRTRRMKPEQRHSTQTSLMLCLAHHTKLDAHRFTVEPLTEQGADGPVSFIRKETTR